MTDRTVMRNEPVSPEGGLRKITAIVRNSALQVVERRLRELDVPGVSVTKVKGYGEYANFFTSDWIVEHARLEIFLPATQADAVARAIVDTATTGAPGDGIVVILPVESMYRIRTGECIRYDSADTSAVLVPHDIPGHERDGGKGPVPG